MRLEDYFLFVFLKNTVRREREKREERNNPAYITNTVSENFEEILKSEGITLPSEKRSELRDKWLPQLIKKKEDFYKKQGEELKRIEEELGREIDIGYREAVNKLHYTREDEEILLEGLRNLSQP
jgi:hypothetical protein